MKYPAWWSILLVVLGRDPDALQQLKISIRFKTFSVRRFSNIVVQSQSNKNANPVSNGLENLFYNNHSKENFELVEVLETFVTIRYQQ